MWRKEAIFNGYKHFIYVIAFVICYKLCDWILENWPKCNTKQPSYIIATLMHYPFTVELLSLADYYAFLEWIVLTMSSHDWDNRAHGGHYKKDMSLKLTPVIVRCLFGTLGMSGPMAGASCTRNYSKQS